jgi:hypothetical protein
MNKIQTATYYLGAWFCLTIGLLLTACSDDDATDRRESNRTIQLSAGARQFQLIDDLSAAPGITRGVLYPDQTNENDETAWKKFEPTDQPNILLFVAKGKDNPTSSDIMSRLFAFSATKNDWQANITIIDTDPKYYIYGFMPIDAQNTSDNVNIGLLPSATNYNAGAQLSINGLKVLTDKDPCVIVGVAKPTEENSTLQWGQFQWGTFEFQFKPNGEKVTDYMGILLDHIYSQYHFKLKIDADYAKLRTIRITGITLEALDIYGYTVSSVDATVTLNKTTGSNPLSTPTFKYNRGTWEYPLYTKPDNSYGQELTTNYADFGFCLAPCSQRWFCLTTSYDVLDTKGTVIRQDEAVNKFDVRALIGNDITNTDPGLMHTIQITVNPTYLYMLSDPDLDNPKLTIN